MKYAGQFAKQHTRQQGLTLVEIIVAIAVFSIIMLALSGTIVQGLQIRRQNSVQAQAVAYANSVIEQYKSFWSDLDNYQDYNKPTGNKPNLPPTTGKPFAAGLTLDATQCAYYNKATKKFEAYTEQGCIDNEGGDLRIITITVTDEHGKQLVHLVSEVGRPVL